MPCFHRRYFRYKALPVYDDAEEDIARFFGDATRFIARVRPLKPSTLVFSWGGLQAVREMVCTMWAPSCRTPQSARVPVHEEKPRGLSNTQ